MPLQILVNLNKIQSEFGGTNPISLSEYRGDGGTPSSGAISLQDFYGTFAPFTYLPRPWWRRWWWMALVVAVVVVPQVSLKLERLQLPHLEHGPITRGAGGAGGDGGGTSSNNGSTGGQSKIANGGSTVVPSSGGAATMLVVTASQAVAAVLVVMEPLDLVAVTVAIPSKTWVAAVVVPSTMPMTETAATEPQTASLAHLSSMAVAAVVVPNLVPSETVEPVAVVTVVHSQMVRMEPIISVPVVVAVEPATAVTAVMVWSSLASLQPTQHLLQLVPLSSQHRVATPSISLETTAQ